MKKLFLLMGVAAISLTQYVNAQTTMPQAPAQQLQQGQMKSMTPADRAQKQTDMMATKLNLNADTKAKVQAINLKYAQKKDALMKGGASKDDMMAQMKQMRTDQDGELKGVLTADQYKSYTDMRGQGMRPGMQQAKPAGN